MALITEDGTGRADAESYCTVAKANAFHKARGRTEWEEIDPPAKEQYLRLATDYMAVYRGRWDGYRKTSTQALDWPRYAVPMKDAYVYGGQNYYPDDEVPLAVQHACAELAFKASQGAELTPDLSPPVVREKLGPIETEYLPGARQTTRFAGVESMLAPFLCASGSSMKVSRA